MRHSLVFALIALAAASVGAQNYPLPGTTSEPTFCGTCPAPYTGLPTWPYAPPLEFVGRYLDSTQVRDVQSPVRTYRAHGVAIVPELDRVFMIIGGGTFATYELSTFIDAQLGSPLATAPNGEAYLPFFSSVYPESPGSGWTWVAVDGQDRLGGFDWDERGFRYLAYSVFGWGIVRDDGSLVAQVPAGAIVPARIAFLRDGDRSYVAVSGNGSASEIYDVTDPASPLLVRTLPFGIRSFAKVSDGVSHTIAIVDDAGGLKVFEAGALVSGGAPEAEVVPEPGQQFRDVTADGLRFFALQSTGVSSAATSSISVVANESSAWVETASPLPGAGSARTVAMDGGVLVVTGARSSPSFEMYLELYRWVANAPQLLDLGGFFDNYYMTPPPGFAGPGRTGVFRRGVPLLRDGSYLVFAPAQGLGDVYRVGIVPNGPPVLAPLAPDPAPVGSELRLTLAATDPEGGALRFHSVGLPDGATLDPATGELVWTPAPHQIGAHSVRLGVADPDGRVDFQDVLLVVPPPGATITGGEATEGSAGSTAIVQITVTLSTPSGSEVRVDWTTMDQTATAGSDYLGASGTLVFAPGETSKTIDLSIFGDDDPEPDETFEIVLSAPDGATLAADRATVAILTDEVVPVPALSSWLLAALALAIAVTGVFRARS